jgi:ferredoxin
MKRPAVDLGVCTLCMGCVAICPQVFILNQLGFIEVVEMESYPQVCVDEAIKYCPEDAIVWESENDTGNGQG